jgi:Domain of Unknown Function (DUF1259)
MMRTKILIGIALTFLVSTNGFSQSGSPAADTNNWKLVEEAMGRSGQQTGDTIKFGLPRKDLHVTLDGVDIKATLALARFICTRTGS